MDVGRVRRVGAEIVNLTVPHQDAMLATLPLQDVWGIGRRYRRLLQANGIHTAVELRDAQDKWLRQEMGMAVIDHINTQMGTGTIQYAAVGLKPQWIMRRARRSPRYTTKWGELLQVKAV